MESHANPTQTPQHTKAPWYFLWLQGGLKFGDKLWFGLAWPGVIFGALLLLPYLDRNPSRQFRHRKVALAGGALAIAYLGFMSYAGLPGYGIQQTGSQELLTEFVPVEGEGIVDHTDWAALPDVATTLQVTVDDDGELDDAIVIQNGQETDLEDADFLSAETHELFEEFQNAVVSWTARDPRFLEPVAELSIEPWVYAYQEGEDGQQVPVNNPETGEQEILVKRASVDLSFLSTEVDAETGEITPIEDAAGQEVRSRSTQVDFLHRDAHETPMEDVATEAREASQ